MLTTSIQSIAKDAPLDRVSITAPQTSAVLATPTLAYAGFAAGWLAGDIVRSVFNGG